MSTTKIRITAGATSFDAELNESETARAVVEALPITGRASTWGQEIYFSIPVQQAEAVDAKDVLPAGSLAYWPPGNAFCIIWGMTPAGDCRFASAANPIGKVLGSLDALDGISSGTSITIEAV